MRLLSALQENLCVVYGNKVQEAHNENIKEANASYSENLQAIIYLIRSFYRLSRKIRSSEGNLGPASFFELDKGNDLYHGIQEMNPQASDSLCQWLAKSVALRFEGIFCSWSSLKL